MSDYPSGEHGEMHEVIFRRERLKKELRDSQGAIRSAIGYVLKSEEGEIDNSPFQKTSYQDTVHVLNELAKENVIPSDWRKLLALDAEKTNESLLHGSAISKEKDHAKMTNDIVGEVEKADGSWSEKLKEQGSAQDITRMSWEALKSERATGSVNPPLRSMSFITNIRLPARDGSVQIMLPMNELQKLDAQNIPCTKDEEYVKKENDININVGLAGEHAKTFPVPLGCEMVGCKDEDGVMVSRSKQMPGVLLNLDANGRPNNKLPGYTLRTQEEAAVPIDRSVFQPSLEEQKYWATVFPLPEELRKLCEEHREQIPAVVASWIRENFMYVCHDAYGKFLGKHKDDLPIIIDELRMGHCDILSWVSSAYFRQLGVPCFLTTEMVTNQVGSAFKRDIGHARLMVIDSEDKLGVFDATRICAAPLAMTPDHLPKYYFEELEKEYVKAKTEPEKRNILRVFLDRVRANMLDVDEQLNKSNLRFDPSVFSPRNFLDGLRFNSVSNDLLLGMKRSEEIHLAERELDRSYLVAPFTPNANLEYWVKYLENFIVNDGFGSEAETMFMSHNMAGFYQGNDIKSYSKKKVIRVLFAEYVGAFASNGLPPQDQALSGSYETLRKSSYGNLCFERGDLGITGILDLLNDNKVFQEVLPKKWNTLMKNLSSVRTIQKFTKSENINFKPTDSYGLDKGIVKNAGYSFYSELGDFTFSIDFGLEMSVALESGDIEKYFGRITNDRNYASLTTELAIFSQLACRAFTNDKLRSSLSEQCLLSTDFWKKFSRFMYSVDDLKPKVVVPGTDGIFRLNQEVRRQTGDKIFNHKACEEMLYIPRKELVKARQLLKRFFEGVMPGSSKGKELDFDHLAEYNPESDDLRSISATTSARAGVPMVKKYKESREDDSPIHIVFDYSGLEYNNINIAFSVYFEIKTILVVLAEIQSRSKKPIYLSCSGVGQFVEYDYRKHRPEEFAALLISREYFNLYKNEFDLRILKSGKVSMPENLVFLSSHAGKVGAVKFQLDKKVSASTYADIGCDLHAHVKPQWVEAGEEEVKF